MANQSVKSNLYKVIAIVTIESIACFSAAYASAQQSGFGGGAIGLALLIFILPVIGAFIAFGLIEDVDHNRKVAYSLAVFIASILILLLITWITFTLVSIPNLSTPSNALNEDIRVRDPFFFKWGQK